MASRLSYYLLAAAILLVFNSQAQVQFSIRVSASEIGSKDQLVADYIISGSDRVINFQPPSFKNWQLITGPVISTQDLKVNGVKVSTTHYSYFLQPTSTGKLKIPTTSVEVDDKVYHCAEAGVTVKKQEHVAGAANGFTPPPVDETFSGGDVEEVTLKPGDDPLKVIRANLFVKAVPNKTKVFAGEPVLVDYKLYERVRATSRVTKQPAFTNCSVADLITNVRDTIEVVNGKKFLVKLFRKVVLLPIHAGSMEAGSTTVESEVTFANTGAALRDSYYDKPDDQVQVVAVASDPVKIEVLPLPAAAADLPVGQFGITATLKQPSMPLNETNSLVVTISGHGNFNPVQLPEIAWPKHLYHFDARENDSIDKNVFPFTGGRTFEIPFEADSLGSLTIPQISFAYFDAATASVRTVHTEAISVTATKAIPRQTFSTNDTAKNGNVSYLYWSLGAILLVGVVVIIFRSRKRKRLVAPVATAEETIIREEKPDAATMIEQLLLVQGDAAFYQQASAVAQRLRNEKMGNFSVLETVIRDCETMLYTPIAVTSKKEVIEKLQAAVS